MPLQSSASGANPLNMSEVKSEFGGTSPPTTLTSYVRNSSYVPTNDFTSTIPTAPTITLLDFLSGSAAGFTAVEPEAVEAIDVGNQVEVDIIFRANGTYIANAYSSGINTDIPSTPFRSSESSGSDYYIKATVINSSGDYTFTGTTGSWLQCNQDRRWAAEQELDLGSSFFELNIQISTSASDVDIFDNKIFNFTLET